MVLMQHTMSFCVGNMNDTFFVQFIGSIHMPLFFFISGWFSFKLTETGKIRMPNIQKRILQLLLPMVLVSTIWLYLAPYCGFPGAGGDTWDFVNLWLEDFKFGYWFTPVLFEIILIYAIMTLVLNSIKSAYAQMLAVACVWVLLFVMIHFMPLHCKQLFSFSLVICFYPIFMFGVFCRKHKEWFHRLVETDIVQTAAMIVFVLAYMCIIDVIPFSGYFTLMVKPIFHISLAIIAIGIFKQWSESAFNPSRSIPGRYAKMWQYIGRNSLPIYLLHYFFLFPMSYLQVPLNGMANAVVPMLIISVIIAAMITAITLGINYCLSHSKILGLLLLGK